MLKMSTPKVVLSVTCNMKHEVWNKKVKAANYSIDTYKKKIYIYGIALTSDEKDLVIITFNRSSVGRFIPNEIK